uniref:Uncharacterized protein n=1 Tax=Romanomermis culicivorax TaxID=13658 RepID=A0A915K2I2_ROMCU
MTSSIGATTPYFSCTSSNCSSGSTSGSNMAQFGVTMNTPVAFPLLLPNNKCEEEKRLETRFRRKRAKASDEAKLGMSQAPAPAQIPWYLAPAGATGFGTGNYFEYYIH